jgi:hypothetical protein
MTSLSQWNYSESFTSTQQGLPTTNQNVNDVPRHLCTMSRDITSVELRVWS